MPTPIPLHQPAYSEKEEAYVLDSLRGRRATGDSGFSRRCEQWLEKNLGAPKALLTTSGTHALELAALLLDLAPGDEVILPSFTHPSTANAFGLRGARLKFVDIRPDTLNIDERRIEEALSAHTKVIVPVHYAGVACEMGPILRMAATRDIAVVEDAAQAILSTYRGNPLGTLGTFGCLSFHETKNVACGEGGALLVNDLRYVPRAEILREMGTNRSQFFRGEVEEYTWLDCGSSYLPSETNAATLLAQLERAQAILVERKRLWTSYARALERLEKAGRLQLLANAEHNAHIFALVVEHRELRNRLLDYLRKRGIGAAFHFVPLHSSPAGRKYGDFVGEDRYTTTLSERLIRLPIWVGLTAAQQEFIVDSLYAFFALT